MNALVTVEQASTAGPHGGAACSRPGGRPSFSRTCSGSAREKQRIAARRTPHTTSFDNALSRPSC